MKNYGTGIYRVGYADSNKTELSSFKILRGDRFEDFLNFSKILIFFQCQNWKTSYEQKSFGKKFLY